MGRIRHHHLERSLRRSDLLRRNKAIRGRNIPMQRNLDIIHFSVLNVLSLSSKGGKRVTFQHSR
jgi:hypothetical protein